MLLSKACTTSPPIEDSRRKWLEFFVVNTRNENIFFENVGKIRAFDKKNSQIENFLNFFKRFFKNLTIENAVDIGIGLAIIVIFKIISSPIAYMIVKMFKFKVKDKNEKY